jgi:hypothetical protein
MFAAFFSRKPLKLAAVHPKSADETRQICLPASTLGPTSALTLFGATRLIL